MRRRVFPKTLSCIMAAMMASPGFAADSHAGLLFSTGSVWLNGSNLPKSSAIFPGDLVQTAPGVIATISASGSSLTVLSDSLVKFEADAVNVNHGAITLSTSAVMVAHAGQVTVTPLAKSWTQFELSDVDGKILIAAKKGSLLISEGASTTTLAEGQQTSRNESSDQQPPQEETGKKKKKRAAAAVPGATGGILNSPTAIAIGAGAIAGVITFVLVEGDEPVSPVKP